MFKTHLRQVQNTWIICSATPKSGCERTSDQLRIAALKIPSTGPAAKPNSSVAGCPAHSLLLYIRLYRAFPWWIKISMYPWFFSTWEGQPSLSRSHKSSSSTCTNFPQCPTHFFGSHFILSIRIISIDFALKGEPVPGTVCQYLYLENKYRI